VSAADLDADLVLTMSRRQRIHLLEEFPGAARRIGHIGHVPELVRDVGANPSVPLRQLISSWTRRPNDPKRDIPDPFGKDAVAAANTAALLTTLVEQLAPILKSGGAQP
jgi:protein-tyrosine phosphatase